MPAVENNSIEVYDTTLRDGSQLEGISLTVEDKLRIAEQLDYLGVHFIEGGWPGANPKDDEFFARAQKELSLETSEFVAFASISSGSRIIATLWYLAINFLGFYLRIS